MLLGGRLLQLWSSKATRESQEDIYSKNIPRSATFQLGAGNDGESDDEGREARFPTAKESTTKSLPTEGNKSNDN